MSCCHFLGKDWDTAQGSRLVVLGFIVIASLRERGVYRNVALLVFFCMVWCDEGMR